MTVGKATRKLFVIAARRGSEWGRVLCQTGTDGNGGLDASQKRGAMDDDFVPFALRFCRGIGLPCGFGSCLVLLDSLSDNVPYPSSEVFGLVPATVCKRRVVGSRRCEMPVLVSYIEAQSVPVSWRG